jgi:3-dehydroquinate synthase
MKTIQVTITKTKQTYPIFIGTDILKKITSLFDFTKYTKLFILTDETVAPLLLRDLTDALPQGTKTCILPAGEKAKTLLTMQKIWEAMHKAKLDRKSLVLNLGGGVITDMGGFAASTYTRGIAFLNIPTTLLSQVDASIGGKTGFDFDGIKNLIGTFSQPIGVLLDTRTLQTLPQREFLSGFAEIIKHGLIADRTYFIKVTKKQPLDYTTNELIEIISQSCAIKQQIIEQDETEQGKRKLLNLGHTIGHAIEAVSLTTDTPLSHGEAISIGILAEAKIANILGLLPKKEIITIEKALQHAGLPTCWRTTTKWRTKSTSSPFIPQILEKMQSDKKNDNNEIRFTLLEQIGKGSINKTVSTEVITQVLATL